MLCIIHVLQNISAQLCMFFKFIVANLSFSDPTYNVNESSGILQPVLILSNPSSTTITVQVFSSTDDPTVGECIEHR